MTEPQIRAVQGDSRRAGRFAGGSPIHPAPRPRPPPLAPGRPGRCLGGGDGRCDNHVTGHFRRDAGRSYRTGRGRSCRIPYCQGPAVLCCSPRGHPWPDGGRRDRERCGAGDRRAAQGVPGVHDGDRRRGRPDVHLCRRARVASGSGHVLPAGAEPVRSPEPPEAAAAPAGNQQPLGPGGIPRRQQACHVGLQSP